MGSGWLGLPLARHFAGQGYSVNTSTTSAARLAELASVPSEAHVIDIGGTLDGIESFLQSKTLVVNITSKDIGGFRRLVQKIETSEVEAVLFVSSTSVYPASNTSVSEDAGQESPDHPLVIIEDLFRQSTRFQTTIVRFAGLIGGRRHPGRFFRGGKTVSNPDAGVNLIHLDDCVNIIDRIVTGGIWGETFNACADTHPSKREFYSWAAGLAGMPAPEFADGAGGESKIVDNRKLKRMLGYEFVHPDLMAIRFDD